MEMTEPTATSTVKPNCRVVVLKHLTPEEVSGVISGAICSGLSIDLIDSDRQTVGNFLGFTVKSNRLFAAKFAIYGPDKQLVDVFTRGLTRGILTPPPPAPIL